MRGVAGLWRDIERAIQEGKENAVREGAKVVHRAMLDELRAGSPGGGRRYRRRKRGKGQWHHASKAGRPPARDTGTLIRSAGLEIQRGTDPRAIVGIKRSAPYAKYLDPPDGQPEPRIGRRPFLSTAVRQSGREVQRTITAELDKALRRIT